MYGLIAVKLIVGLLALLLVLRLLGKKELSQITPFDFIYIVILGGILEEAIFDPKATVAHILFAIAVWAILIYLVELIVQKKDFLKKTIKGEPSELIKNGEVNQRVLKKNHIENEQLLTMLRENGVFSLRDVYYALLETSGKITVIEKDGSSGKGQKMPSYMVIDEGVFDDRGIKRAGKDRQWINDYLNQQNMTLDQIFYAEWSESEGWFIIKDQKKKASDRL